MDISRRRWTLFFVVPVILVAARELWAEAPRSGLLPPDTVQAVLDRVQTHAAGDVWKQPNFSDEFIEPWLDKLVGKVAKAAEFPSLALPVRLKDVTAGEAPAAGQNPPPGQLVRPALMQAKLFVGNDVNLRNVMLRDSIVWANGNVEVDRIEGCVIIGRGAINVHSSSVASLIVAGAYVKLASFDGEPNSTVNGSLVISRGWADFGSGYGTLVYAHEGATFERSVKAIFINAPVPKSGSGIAERLQQDNGSRSIQVRDLSIEAIPVHPLVGQLKVLGVLHGERSASGMFGLTQRVSGPTGVLFRFEERRQVAEIGEPIVDEEGQEVEHLRSWKLECLNSRFALFTKPGATAVVRFEKKQPVQP